MLNIRLKLWLIPFKNIQKINKKKIILENGEIPIKKLILTVKSVSNIVPHATCLTQALTAQEILAINGYTSKVKIGVNKDPKGEFEAHAWLEYAEKVVIGESVKEYVSLTDL